MPGLRPGIHILAAATKDMDGRASPTMKRCSEELVQGRHYLEAAE